MSRVITISATVDEEQEAEKRKLSVSWRFLIGKGLAHMRTCVPREQIILEQYSNATRSRAYLRAVHYVKEKYPKVWDEMVINGVMEG